MLRKRLLASLLLPLVTAAYVESISGNVDAPSDKTHARFVPLVSFECGFRNQFVNQDGLWLSDDDRYATCQSGKYDILKYCRKVYPKLNVTNIVEYSHEVEISDWCREEGAPCKWTHTVRPYLCIDGEFRSEALQVPRNCRFSHVNSRQSCNDYQHWKNTAKEQCSSKTHDNKTMAMRSFAVLEPCGLDLFTGVEFVCCPAADVKSEVVEKGLSANTAKMLPKDDLDDDLDDDDEYDDEFDSDEDEDDEKSEVEQDPYFKLTDNTKEHEEFKNAEERLYNKHRSKIEKVMKDWSELDTRYQKMKSKDSVGAEKFKTSMTNRFQKTVAALEEEHKSAKKELEAVHEERIRVALNEKKRTATHDYRQALAVHVGQPNKHAVLLALKKYIRAEEKDRTHTLNKYRHLRRVDPSEAATYKPIAVHKLRYIDLRINGTLAMLRDFPDLETQVRPIALEYWADYRRENSPDVSDLELSSTNTIDSHAKDKKLVDLYNEAYERLHPSAKLDVKAPVSTTSTSSPKIVNKEESDSEEEDDEYYEDEQDEEIKKDSRPRVVELTRKEDIDLSEERLMKTPVKAPKMTENTADTYDSDSSSDEEDDDLELSEEKQLNVDIEPIISDRPAYYRQQKLVQHKTEDVSMKTSPMLLFLIAAIGSAVIMLGVAALRMRRSHYGFVEVDVYTPEERHVAGMQVNGYENPTYSFFDSKA